jgi:hypothetical protein
MSFSPCESSLLESSIHAGVLVNGKKTISISAHEQLHLIEEFDGLRKQAPWPYPAFHARKIISIIDIFYCILIGNKIAHTLRFAFSDSEIVTMHLVLSNTLPLFLKAFETYFQFSL